MMVPGVSLQQMIDTVAPATANISVVANTPALQAVVDFVGASATAVFWDIYAIITLPPFSHQLHHQQHQHQRHQPQQHLRRRQLLKERNAFNSAASQLPITLSVNQVCIVLLAWQVNGTLVVTATDPANTVAGIQVEITLQSSASSKPTVVKVSLPSGYSAGKSVSVAVPEFVK
jgi:hypothetical protein